MKICITHPVTEKDIIFWTAGNWEGVVDDPANLFPNEIISVFKLLL